jgi:hypothetical protein
MFSKTVLVRPGDSTVIITVLHAYYGDGEKNHGSYGNVFFYFIYPACRAKQDRKKKKG